MSVGIRLLTALCATLPVALGLWVCGCDRGDSPPSQSSPSAGELTFNRDIAPIMFEHCGVCHHRGASGPFALLTYQDVAKRATQIVDVTASRYMPPWLPEPGHGDFADQRRLSDDQIAMIRQWAQDGAPAGAPGDLPATPTWPDGWSLGKPDLVVTMGQTYTLPADGRDVYRNFVVPIPIDRTRYVQAMELRTGEVKVVHHAFMMIDPTPASRLLDKAEPGPGFDGMDLRGGARSPSGHFISWQPGKVASKSPPDMAWPLNPGTDLVLQMHMRPSGKPEPIQAQVGFYFTDNPPTKFPTKLVLRSMLIDIPAGEKNYIVEDSYVLPVDVQVLAVLPHAHYLGKRLEGLATLPDGSTRSLLLIRNWDFNWQGDYRYANPVFLPHGTTLTMRFSYDNSTDNVRNPNHPPKPVRYGLESSDEMGELWFQVLPRSSRDRQTLSRDFRLKVLRRIADYNAHRVKLDPGDVEAHIELGRVYQALGPLEDAMAHLRLAARLAPDSARAHYELGVFLLRKRMLPEARAELERALELDPDDFQTNQNLGVAYLDSGQAQLAERTLRHAVGIMPDHPDALYNLGLALGDLGKLDEAAKLLERVLSIQPDNVDAQQNLARIEALRSRND